MVVQNQSELGEGSAMPTDPHHTPTIIESSSQPQKTQKPRKPKRKDTQVPQPSGPTNIVVDEAVHKELGDSLVRATTIASSLETKHVKDYILLPLWTADPPYSQDPKSSHDDGSKPSSDDGKKVDEDPRKDSESNDQEKKDNVNNPNNVNDANINKVNGDGGKTSIELPFDPAMHALEDYSIFDFIKNDEDDVGVEAGINNLDITIQVSPIPTTRIHKDHPLD
ncbi:hypothetical protein Tco_1209469 [Tanacetum coccineum]